MSDSSYEPASLTFSIREKDIEGSNRLLDVPFTNKKRENIHYIVNVVTETNNVKIIVMLFLLNHRLR